MNGQAKTRISRTIVLLVCISLFSCSALAKYSGGTGDANDPYQIADVNDLLTLANDANDYNKCFIMTSDIDLDPCLPGGQVFTTAVISRDTINDYSGYFDGNAFAGDFNGTGHKVRNLSINADNGYDNGNYYLGLFGVIDGGKLKNLGIENVSIICGSGSIIIGGLTGVLMDNNDIISNCYSTGIIYGGGWSTNAGGLVGYNRGHIIDSFSRCNIIAGQFSSCLGGLVGVNAGANKPKDPIIIGDINNCYSTGCVTGGEESDHVGGFVGSNAGNTINCYSTGAVASGDYSEYIGGFAGENVPGYFYDIGGDINNCYSTSAVTGGNGSAFIGGFAGANNDKGDINECFSTGNVTGTYNIGGLVGGNNSDSNIRNSYALSNVTGIGGSNRLGGLVGLNDTFSSITNCYSAGTVSGSSGVGGLVGVNASSINSSYFLDTAGLNNGYGTPLTDEEMKQQASFTGWDFVWETVNGPNDVWAICEGVSYPKLAWEFIAGDSDSDEDVDFADFASMGNKWLQADSHLYCGGADFTGDGIVDIEDLDAFVDNWLY